MKRFFGRMGCRQAVLTGARMQYAGLSLLPLSAVFGAWVDRAAVFYVLALLGAALLVSGWLLTIRRGICPACGQYLGTNFPRAIGKVPDYCPHCGERL